MFSDLADLNYSFNVSDGDPFLDEDWNDPPTQTLSGTGFIVLSVMLGLIMTFGFLNNLVVLILFCRFRALRTPVNMLLLNISVSDMLVCLLGTTLSFASSTQGRWLLGRRGCSWYGFINSCFGIVSLISLVVLSYDRYSTLAVYKKQGPDYRKPLLAVGGSWLYSLIWTVPPLLGWSSYDLEGAGTSCSVSWKLRTAQSHSYVICLFIFCLGLPVLVMMYCYARLLHAVKQFYRCFLALFGCKCSLVESGPSSMPSKTTIMQLNRRIHCTAPATIALGEQGCSTPATLRTNPTSVT
ncbi:teleost multiple tissue opsin 2b isoform X2 [Denticeps clupeoides]|uniref:teleost multiple tissue opsin 2b isoform X2 n=1 Tax=Denticeps clupeoides TaxID=299321 RepID=UPI0010A410E5|nr:opsin-3-like isoform X2 [Denticeps clupeoides]